MICKQCGKPIRKDIKQFLLQYRTEIKNAQDILYKIHKKDSSLRNNPIYEELDTSLAHARTELMNVQRILTKELQKL